MWIPPISLTFLNKTEYLLNGIRHAGGVLAARHGERGLSAATALDELASGTH